MAAPAKTNKRINAAILRFNAIYTLQATTPSPGSTNAILEHSRHPAERLKIFRSQ